MGTVIYIMIRNVIFDIGNVLVTFHPVEYFYPVFKKDTKKICEMVFGSEVWSLYDQGILTKQEVEYRLHHLYPKNKDEISYILAHWKLFMKPIIPMKKLIEELKREGYKIFLLSNISEDSYLYLKQEYPYLFDVDGGIYSYQIKCNKPNMKIYEELLRVYNLNASESLFLDDRKENIDAAKALGFHGMVVMDVSVTCKEIRNELKEEKEC